MKNNSMANGTKIGIAILILLVAAGAITYGTGVLKSSLQTASVVESISTISYSSNTGEVKNGYLYGSKIVASVAVNNDPAEFLIKTAGTEQTWGNYKIKPEYNMLIRTSARPYASSDLTEYHRAYYKGLLVGVLETKEMLATSWNVNTPIRVEIYADPSSLPKTPVLTKEISASELDGQQLVPIGNNFNIQKVANLPGTTQLPDASNILIATAPSFTEFNTNIPNVYVEKTYIFSRAHYDTAIDYFYKLTGEGGVLYNLKNPLMALWTGYDEFSWIGGLCGRYSSKYNNGYCKVEGWNGLGGLPSEVQQPVYNIKYDSANQKIIADPISYSAKINIEIPSEYVKSLAVLRGAGVPQVDFTVTRSIAQGDRFDLTVNVKNVGDSDGFNIVPTSASGKLLFTPASYTSQPIPAGTTKTFKFVMTVSGQETSKTSDVEKVDVIVSPEHNLEARVSQSFYETIAYKPTTETGSRISPGTPTVTTKPSDADTMDTNKSKGGKGTTVNWWETGRAQLLGLLVAALIIVAWKRFKS